MPRELDVQVVIDTETGKQNTVHLNNGDNTIKSSRKEKIINDVTLANSRTETAG